MKIKQLDLKAFGPFSDQIIEFNSEAPGLHVIFGSNEAGKSSALRALKALLYGFHERTADNFNHANNKLLVGGVIEEDEGRELTLYRRKKRKADLLDDEGNPLNPELLSDYLHGVDKQLFESLYGIDHKTLIAGGEEILEQKGEVGQALFTAGTGLTSLREIIDSFEGETSALYKDRGSTQQINRSIKEYKDLKKEVKDASLLPAKWKEHADRLKDAELEYSRLEEKSRKLSAEVHRLGRLNKSIPELAELENLQRQLLDLGEVVLLPEDFSAHVQKVKQDIRETTLQLDRDGDRLGKLHDKQGAMSVNAKVLEHADAIEDLYQRVDRFRKDLKDRIKLDGMRITCRRDAGTLIEGIRNDLSLKDLDTLQPFFGRKKEVQKLSTSFELLNQSMSDAERRKDEAERVLVSVEKAISELPTIKDTSSLLEAVKLGRKKGDIDSQVDDIAREIKAGYKGCQSELKRLGLWGGDLSQLMELNLPQDETVRAYDSDFNEISQEIRQLEKDYIETKTDLASAKTDSKEVLYSGDVPSEEMLKVSRVKRQDGWQLLKKKWVDGCDISEAGNDYDPENEIHEAYEKRVEDADLIADRLRWEADRVAKSATLKARIEGFEEKLQNLLNQKMDIANRETSLTEKWKEEWEGAGIIPLSPREMLPWLVGIDRVRNKLSELLNKEFEKSDKESEREKCASLLVATLQEVNGDVKVSSDELATVLVSAESVLQDFTEQKAKWVKLSDEQVASSSVLEKSLTELTTAKAALGKWQSEWSKHVSGLVLKDEITPSSVNDILETIGDCFTKLNSAKEFQARIDGIDRDVQLFKDDTDYVLGEVAPELKGLSPEQSVLQLYPMLNKALQDNKLRQQNDVDIESIALDVNDAKKKLQSLESQMGEYYKIAKCNEYDELNEAIRLSGDFVKIREKVSFAESSLAKVSEGWAIDEIKEQAVGVVVDELPAQISNIKRQIEQEVNPNLHQSLKLIGEENKELQLMDGSSKAAESAEKMELVAAKIKRLSDQYVKVKLATALLHKEVEKYREENQGPILKLASVYFSKLTIGSFSGLRTDIDDNGNPVMIGVRSDGSWVRVDGMSDGTCDQLYLALRLATLESRLENNAPMPFIVDDILINFDDERSKATLSLLGELSNKNQVILFTHHKQIVSEVESLGVEAEVVVHDLGN